MDINAEAWKVTRRLVAGESSVVGLRVLYDTVAYQMRNQLGAGIEARYVATTDLTGDTYAYSLDLTSNNPWLA